MREDVLDCRSVLGTVGEHPEDERASLCKWGGGGKEQHRVNMMNKNTQRVLHDIVCGETRYFAYIVLQA